MSANVESEASDMMRCAACGITEVGEIKLKTCTACKSVRYCSVACQRGHRPQHKRDCKKRAAELRDEILFKQPESRNEGDCPICLLPLPIDSEKSALMGCCCKMICYGCSYANQMEEMLKHKCPFCRHPLPDSKEKFDHMRMKRAEANDPVALRGVGMSRYKEGDYKSAFEYFSKAAGLGEVGAHFSLSYLYRDGKGVEKDNKKLLHHLEEAAIGGNPSARYILGCTEEENGRLDRAVKHFIIAANLGDDDAMVVLKDGFKRGLVSKEVLASALRAHHAAVDATKSPLREEAEAALQNLAAQNLDSSVFSV